jgi:hypothetical protein
MYFGFMKIWDFIKADRFFTKYCRSVKNYKHKIRKESGNATPIDFTLEEIKQIQKGIDRMYKDLKKAKP